MITLIKNKFIKTLLNAIVLVFVMGCITWSCADDLIYEQSNYYNDGTLHMSIAFEPLYGVENTTRTSGKAIGDLKSLVILFYDLDGKLVNSLTQWGEAKGDGDADILDWKLNQSENYERPEKQPEDTPADAVQSKDSTALATFRIQNIPYGKYRIYAVANIEDLITGENTKEAVKTESGLKSIALEWNSKEIAANDQMFGYFSPQLNDENAYSRPGDFDAPEVIVSKNTPTLHAWVRRAASKVTIAYDGKELKDNVWVYIHKVTIRDIPRTCLLGEINTPKEQNQLIEEGGSLFYNNDGVTLTDPSATDYTQWLTITNDDTDPVGSDHSNGAQALFFYENMQGDYEKEENKEKYDKRQSASPKLGVLVDPGDPDYKDEVPYGTWIEVEAFYDSRNPENITSGKIIYRFMLGKNITYNYNAERNHHFKLTLKFNGWANQADWHIEYTEDSPSINTPPMFYMPYLYNQQAMFPMTLNGNLQSLQVEIIENGWAPVSVESHEVPNQNEGSFTWNKPAYERFPPWEGTKEVDGAEKQGYPQLGFLALAVPDDDAPEKNILDDYNYRTEGAYEALDEYYSKEYSYDGYTYSQKKRTYDVNPGTHQPGYNEYIVTKAQGEGESYSVQIPLWTRNKTMIQNSGFTGNNPYEAFERKAIIRISATFMVNGKTELRTKEVPIYQVRRIVNPKGIWRSRNNGSEEFLVHLKTLDSPNATEYSELVSNGSWDASIESGDKDFCFITKSSTATTGSASDVIKGNTGSEIRFYVKFKGNLESGISKGCIININYDGGTCTHKILVRQGYDEEVPIVGNSPLWSSFNLFKVNCTDNYNNTSYYTLDAELTCNPLAVGSLFRRRNYNNGILILNNNEYGPLTPLGPTGEAPIKVAQKDNNGNWVEKKWSDIEAYHTENANTLYKWASFSATPSGSTTAKTYRVPTYEEFKALDQADYAIGVMYADGATKTQKSFSDAYEYEDGENTLSRSEKGVRGFIVYNAETGHQIFFPIGRYGMARRTVFNIGDSYNAGYLRYGDVYAVLSGETNELRPIPYDLAHCPGAVYWINLPKAGGHAEGGYCCGWDMNYFSLDFSSYTDNNSRDACPIKLVTDANN